MAVPDPVSIEVRCFVVVGTGGVVLVDTGPPGTGAAIGEALARVGAAWSDVTDIVLTHRHFDHVRGLAESAELASGATVLAGADDAPEIPFEIGCPRGGATAPEGRLRERRGAKPLCRYWLQAHGNRHPIPPQRVTRPGETLYIAGRLCRRRTSNTV